MTLAELADKHGTDKGEWQGFMPYYEKYLPPKNKAITLVELGVQKGNSIAMWEEYFQYAKIIGVDIDLSQIGDRMYTSRVELIQGEQDDFRLADAIMTYRKADVVIDDASHVAQHTIEAFHAYWNNMKPGGLYVVEDTHCSYDTKHYGVESAAAPPEYEDLRKLISMPLTTMQFLKRLADDVNWNHHGHNRFIPVYQDVAFVHFYPGICFIGKKEAADG